MQYSWNVIIYTALVPRLSKTKKSKKKRKKELAPEKNVTHILAYFSSLISFYRKGKGRRGNSTLC